MKQKTNRLKPDKEPKSRKPKNNNIENHVIHVKNTSSNLKRLYDDLVKLDSKLYDQRE
jgi:hypothetical protein